MNRTPARSPRVGSRRAAYTLIEMLISAVLVSTLMAGAWNLMSLYNDLLAAGQKRATEIQLVRSVLQLVSDDLALLQPGESGTDSDGSFATGDTDAFDSFQSEFVDFASADDATSQPILPVLTGLTGTSSALRLTVYSESTSHQNTLRTPSTNALDELNRLGCGSLSRGEFANQDSAQPHIAPEFRTIVYQWQGQQERSRDDLEFPVGLSDSLEDIGEDQADAGARLDSSQGLLRIEAPAAEVAALEQSESSFEQSLKQNSVALTPEELRTLLQPDTGDLADSVAQGPKLEAPHVFSVPEVTACQFRYFDGRTWYSQWPIDDSDSLPSAVQIRFRVRMPASSRQRAKKSARIVAGIDTAADNSSANFSRQGETAENASGTSYARTIVLRSAPRSAVGLAQMGGRP